MDENLIGGLTSDIIGFVSENRVASAVGAGVIGAGIIGAGLAMAGSKSKRRSRRTSATKKGRSRDRKFKSKQKHEQRYKRKGKFKVYHTKKSKSRKYKKTRNGIKYTKNGQPYKILANGRARFIKK